MLPRIYATFAGPLSLEQQMIVGALHGGPGAQVTGSAALRWYGLRYVPTVRRIAVLVPLASGCRSLGFVQVVRTSRPDPHSHGRAAMEVCSPTRAAADTVRAGMSLREARALLSEAVQHRWTTAAELMNECRAGPRRGSGILGQVLAELAEGVRSAPEAELRALLGSSRSLPHVSWNPRLVSSNGVRLPTPDGWIQEVGLAVEVDSVEFHSSPEDQRRTRQRRNELAAHGVQCLHFTPREIRERPAWVLDLIERAVQERPPGFDRVTAT